MLHPNFPPIHTNYALSETRAAASGLQPGSRSARNGHDLVDAPAAPFPAAVAGETAPVAGTQCGYRAGKLPGRHVKSPPLLADCPRTPAMASADLEWNRGEEAEPTAKRDGEDQLGRGWERTEQEREWPRPMGGEEEGDWAAAFLAA